MLLSCPASGHSLFYPHPQGGLRQAPLPALLPPSKEDWLSQAQGSPSTISSPLWSPLGSVRFLSLLCVQPSFPRVLSLTLETHPSVLNHSRPVSATSLSQFTLWVHSSFSTDKVAVGTSSFYIIPLSASCLKVLLTAALLLRPPSSRRDNRIQWSWLLPFREHLAHGTRMFCLSPHVSDYLVCFLLCLVFVWLPFDNDTP